MALIHKQSVHTKLLKSYYIILPGGIVQLNDAPFLAGHSTVGTKDGSCKTTHTFDANWFEYYCRLNHISEQNAIINREILMNLIPDTLYTLYYLEDQVIACGMAVVEDGYLGLFDITVSEEHRNLGYGAKLIGSMLSLGKECGAKTAYLQVMLNNPSAFHLYQKFGFTQMYQYHYGTTPK